MARANNTLNFIDVFSGAGGLSHGLEMAGMRCLLGIDSDKHAIKTFAKNHHHAATFSGDVKNLTPKELYKLIGDNPIHAIVGGPPCQGFSTVGPGNPEDTRNSLFMEFFRLVKVLRPYFIVIENVTGLLARKNEKTLKSIFDRFHKIGYNLNVQVMSAENYGVPERRRRTIIIGSRINDAVMFPKPTHNTQVGRYFIPPMNVGDALKNIKNKNGEILNHDLDQAVIKSKIELDRLKCIPEGKGIRYEKDEALYLPKKLKLNVDWQTIREGRFRQTKYQRLDRKLPSPTIMTHRHSYYHPIEHRYLTQREAASIQSFPPHFEFVGPVSAQWRQIGNAVPPGLGKAIGKSLVHMFQLAQKSGVLESPNRLRPGKFQLESIRGKAFHYKENKNA